MQTQGLAYSKQMICVCLRKERKRERQEKRKERRKGKKKEERKEDIKMNKLRVIS